MTREEFLKSSPEVQNAMIFEAVQNVKEGQAAQWAALRSIDKGNQEWRENHIKDHAREMKDALRDKVREVREDGTSDKQEVRQGFEYNINTFLGLVGAMTGVAGAGIALWAVLK